MKKWFFVNAVLTGVLSCIFLTSGMSSEDAYFHAYKDGIGGRYIIPDKFIKQDGITGGKITFDCPRGLFFNCILICCVTPAEGCPCTEGLEP